MKESKEVDIYRDTLLRYLGYANEVGEAFRSLVHVNWVRLSYVVAMGYVTADANDKGQKAAKNTLTPKDAVTGEVTKAVVDTFMWQALASVIVPGFTINRLCFATALLLKRSTKLAPAVQKWTTTGVGLSAIPFIIHPIDNMVHVVMNYTVRHLAGIPKYEFSHDEDEKADEKAP